MRACASCGLTRDVTDYSSAQWAKGVGASRCSSCVANGDAVDAGQMVPTARDNDATGATWSAEALDHPFAEGTFRFVAKGTYTDGDRAGQPCVFKWFKTGGVMEDHYFAANAKVVAKAVELVRAWNAAGLLPAAVQINRPTVWPCLPDTPRARRKVLIEPYLPTYRRFNSNSGWAATAGGWDDAMQALSHWSYHTTSGQLVLADLHGAVRAVGDVLTDPVLLSTTAGAYGVADLGPAGIQAFFERHACGRYCSAAWTRPRRRGAAALLPLAKGTTMLCR